MTKIPITEFRHEPESSPDEELPKAFAEMREQRSQFMLIYEREDDDGVKAIRILTNLGPTEQVMLCEEIIKRVKTVIQ